MRRLHFFGVLIIAALLGTPAASWADGDADALDARVARALTEAWRDAALTVEVAAPATHLLAQPQGRAARTAAGPNIGTVGLGAVGGLSEFEIGPSFRFWATDRIGVQAHLGFSGDDLGPEDVKYIRFEPTVIVAIGDFGEGSVNVRPYAGGGLRVIRTDLGRFNDQQVKPVGVGGVEFGFRATPQFKASVEVSVAPGIDAGDFDLGGATPNLSGARFAALAHYFF